MSPLINRAAAYLLKGKFEEAVKDYGTAIEGRPDDPLLYQQRAVAYKSIAKFDEAVADLRKPLNWSAKTDQKKFRR